MARRTHLIIHTGSLSNNCYQYVLLPTNTTLNSDLGGKFLRFYSVNSSKKHTFDANYNSAKTTSSLVAIVVLVALT